MLWCNATEAHDAAGEDTTANLYVIASSLSLAAATPTLLRGMRAHSATTLFPKRILFYKCAADALLCATLLFINSALLAGPHDAMHETGRQLCATDGFGVLSFLAGLSLSASTLWSIALAFSLNRSIHDPFTRPESRLPAFHVAVWAVSIGVGMAVSHSSAYQPYLHLCWSCLNDSFLFVLLTVIFCFVTSLALLTDATVAIWFSLPKGTPRAHVNVSALYVLGFGLNFLAIAVCFTITILRSDPETVGLVNTVARPSRYLTPIFLGLLGPMDAAFYFGESLLYFLRTSRTMPSECEADTVGEARRFMPRPRLPPTASTSVDVEVPPDAVADAADADAAAALPPAIGASPSTSSIPTTPGRWPVRWQGAEQSSQKHRDKRKKRRELDRGDLSHWLRREFVEKTIEGVRLSVEALKRQPAAQSAAAGLPKEVELAEVPQQQQQQPGQLEVASAVDADADTTVDRRAEAPGVSLIRRSMSLKLPSVAAFVAPPKQSREVRLSSNFAELSPQMFESLRTGIFGTDLDTYLGSFSGSADEMLLSFSEGKGGGFFFWTHDQRFLVKTLEPAEYAALGELLPEYCNHLRGRRKSLLPRFYGCYSITIPITPYRDYTQRFVVMESIFFGAPGRIHERYDLKGSWIDRHAALPDPSAGTYKDMDLHRPLRIDEAIAKDLHNNLWHDTKFLRDNGLMDYSLLLGVHNRTHDSRASAALSGKMATERHIPDDVCATRSLPANKVDAPLYLMGLIDVLQEWNFAKRLERWSKIIFKWRFAPRVRSGMSAIEPDAYRDRFLSAMSYQFGLGEGYPWWEPEHF